jgi:hypothetical protein
MLQTATDTRTARKSLVRTYDHPSYRDPWRVVGDYRRVQQAAEQYPDESAGVLSTKPDIPRSRLQP